MMPVGWERREVDINSRPGHWLLTKGLFVCRDIEFLEDP